jgi:hypothetical protein
MFPAFCMATSLRGIFERNRSVFEGVRVVVVGVKAFLGGEPSLIPYKLKIEERQSLSRAFSGVGTPVHNLRPVQNLPYLRMAMESAGLKFDNDAELLLAVAELYQPELEKVATKILGRGVAEILPRPPKLLCRMREKEIMDGLSIEGHTDLAAIAVFSRTERDLIRHTNNFRPCNNAMVAQMKEKTATPEDGSSFAANTIKIIIERDIGTFEKVPFVCEIQSMLDGCQKEYKSTHKGIEEQRGLLKFFNLGERKGRQDPNVLVAAGYVRDKAEKKLRKTNQAMAKATGLDELQQNRTYYMVDDVPVMHATNKRGDDLYLIPDTKTGLYRHEASYANKIQRGTVIKREDFIIASRALVPTPDVSNSGRILPQLVVNQTLENRIA